MVVLSISMTSNMFVPRITPQFLIIPRKDNRPPRKHHRFKGDLKKYEKAGLVAD